MLTLVAAVLACDLAYDVARVKVDRLSSWGLSR